MTEDEADSSRPAHIDSAQLRRVSAGSLIGTAIEWYDYFIYGLIAALALNELFFPTFDPAVATIVAFLSFAIGFVARAAAGVQQDRSSGADRPRCAAHHLRHVWLRRIGRCRPHGRRARPTPEARVLRRDAAVRFAHRQPPTERCRRDGYSASPRPID